MKSAHRRRVRNSEFNGFPSKLSNGAIRNTERSQKTEKTEEISPKAARAQREETMETDRKSRRHKEE
jgi:hypothetical protein